MIMSSLVAAADGSFAPGQTFRDCPQCPLMTVVPAGEVSIGDPKDFEDIDPLDPGAPQRPRVKMPRSFAIGTYEVTQAEWASVMGTRPGDNNEPTLPVVNVSWRMIQDYVAKLSAKTGKPYRLPSEAEWEYSARAGSSASYSFGEDASQLGRFAWIDTNSGGTIHPVGQLEPNAFGLYDMHGNAWEWTADCYTSNYSKILSRKDADEIKGFCYRVIRGGSVLNFAKYATVFNRATLTQINNSPNLSFRVALTLP